MISVDTSNASLDIRGQTTSQKLKESNRYALFEEYLSFLKTELAPDGTPKMLNAVLLGYWCNLFKSLV